MRVDPVQVHGGSWAAWALLPEKSAREAVPQRGGGRRTPNGTGAVPEAADRWPALRRTAPGKEALHPVEPAPGPPGEALLQLPNPWLQTLARSIVDPRAPNDEKAHRILLWVQEHIRYVSDREGYGVPEYWAPPTVTARRRQGDCEDGALLLHSLLLHAGVAPDRVRTYAGVVAPGPGSPGGGHAWTAYRRESDGEWVALDWAYRPDPSPVADRPPLREDPAYLHVWFTVDARRPGEPIPTGAAGRGGLLDVWV
ncbi:MAG: hypothetical protein Kow0092_27120 [Deferrisomatales bacterium]